jgi:tRNA threonylcarbamoyladenosine biosynthesis protein TsaB
MKFLALDTSSNACSVALQIGDEITTSHVIKPREHTAILIPMIEQILRDADEALEDLDGIVLGNGPGSFIGMRIAASVVQGIAYAAGIKVVPVSSLAAIAAEAFATHEGERVVVTQDARMSEVYLAIFSRDADGLPRAEGDVSLHNTSETIAEQSGGAMLAAGAGWQSYPEFLEINSRLIVGRVDVLYPNARYLLSSGIRNWDAGRAISPEQIVPEYVRMKVADKPVAQTQ